MSLKGWDSTYSLGIPEMDGDHQRMMDMIVKLHGAMKKGQSKDVMGGLIQELDSYAKLHFDKEEKYMMKINHPDMTEQKKQHEYFLGKVDEFRMYFSEGKMNLAIELLPFLNSWFSDHIMRIDKKYSKQ